MDTAREHSDLLLDLLRREQSALADFLLALAAFDRERLWMRLGYASLFQYLHRELGMSKGAAHYRKTAAELIQRVPAVVEPLRAGKLCITSIIELAKVLTPENQAEVLPRFLHCSRQEAKAVSAELCPVEAVPTRTVVTAMAAVPSPPPTPVPVPVAVPLVQPIELVQDVARPSRAEPLALAPPVAAPRSVAEPLTADLRRLHVTVSKRFMDKLEAARDALSHSHPGSDVEAILEAGLDLIIERAAKRKGLVEKPRPAPSPSLSTEGAAERGDPREGERAESRYIPAGVKRAVWIRDEGRCQFRLENGERCGSTHRLQFDHVRPFALGGVSTVENVRLTCAGHNLLAARRVLGDSLVDRYALARSAATTAEPR